MPRVLPEQFDAEQFGAVIIGEHGPDWCNQCDSIQPHAEIRRDVANTFMVGEVCLTCGRTVQRIESRLAPDALAALTQVLEAQRGADEVRNG